MERNATCDEYVMACKDGTLMGGNESDTESQLEYCTETGSETHPGVWASSLADIHQC